MPTQAASRKTVSAHVKPPARVNGASSRARAAVPATLSAADTSESDTGTTSALTRLLQILDLFTLQRPTVRVDEVVQTFGIVQSTAYRYLRELCDAGLLAQQGKGVYSLGRRIVELERLLQQSDPLLLAGKPVMEDLRADCRNRAFLLCAYYKDSALCVYKVGPDEIQYRGAPMKILRDRGTLLPLFSGAGSQVILAGLPPHQIKSLYLANGRLIADAGMGDSWKAFRSYLGEIRKQGFAQTIGKMNPGMHSIAVPVMRADGKVAGSLLMLGAASTQEMSAGLDMVPMLQARAADIAELLPQAEPNGERE